MGYCLMLYDTELIRFSVLQNLADPVLQIERINESSRELLPLGMEPDAKGLAHWLRHRTIPKNRAFVNSFLAKCGLSPNRPMDIISMCKGLSLNDAYWIKEEGSEKNFDDVNLYDNRFSRILGELAFTGFGGNVRSLLVPSPEFTTNGMLPKCWRRHKGMIELYKGATTGLSHTGNEPYSEMYASQIGARLGFNVIPYRISTWKGQLCSVCGLFTNKELAYVPISTIVKQGGMPAVREYYEKLGPAFVKALNEMIVFDALICNTDRHFGNFGFLVESRTNRIMAPAPLFDHGNSLFNLAGEENWCNEDNMRAYVSTLMPCVYDSFVEEAKAALDHDLREKVRSALNISIKTHGRKDMNLGEDKRKMMSELIQAQAIEILG